MRQAFLYDYKYKEMLTTLLLRNPPPDIYCISFHIFSFKDKHRYETAKQFFNQIDLELQSYVQCKIVTDRIVTKIVKETARAIANTIFGSVDFE